MGRFKSCIGVFILFALFASLAFFSPNSENAIQSEEDSIMNAPPLSPIPQRVDSIIKNQILIKNVNPPLSANQSFLNKGSSSVLDSNDSNLTSQKIFSSSNETITRKTGHRKSG